MGVRIINSAIERQAKLMAADAREAAPDIVRIIWFPDEREVRLVQLTEQVDPYLDAELYAFHFPAAPAHDLPAPNAVAMIRPNEVERLSPPAGWGEWSDGVDL